VEEPTEPPLTRWEQQVVGERWTFYTDRFDMMTAEGADLEGEARFVDAMAQRGSAVLDAGCGTGRIAAALTRMGHRAIGVDKDQGLIDIATGRYPGVSYLTSDLLLLTPELLEASGGPADFDIIALPGNVLVYLAPGSERQLLALLTGLLRPSGRIVAGFATDRDYSPAQLVADAAEVGLWTEDADWLVVVLRAGDHRAQEDGTTWPSATAWSASAAGGGAEAQS
jgi:SAM-dependent methyltransferase